MTNKFDQLWQTIDYPEYTIEIWQIKSGSDFDKIYFWNACIHYSEFHDVNLCHKNMRINASPCFNKSLINRWKLNKWYKTLYVGLKINNILICWSTDPSGRHYMAHYSRCTHSTLSCACRCSWYRFGKVCPFCTWIAFPGRHFSIHNFSYCQSMLDRVCRCKCSKPYSHVPILWRNRAGGFRIEFTRFKTF